MSIPIISFVPNFSSDWVDNEVVTWRSGIRLSSDGRTLYYFADPGLQMAALGQSMTGVGVAQGRLPLIALA